MTSWELVLIAATSDYDGTIAALTALIVAVTGFVAAVTKLWRRDNYTDDRVDLLWKANLRMGEAEAKQNELLIDSETVGDNMPLELRPDVRAAFEPIAPFLKKLYDKWAVNKYGTFAELIEKESGAWLTTHICPVFKANRYSCVKMAEVVALEQINRPESAKVI